MGLGRGEKVYFRSRPHMSKGHIVKAERRESSLMQFNQGKILDKLKLTRNTSS